MTKGVIPAVLSAVLFAGVFGGVVGYWIHRLDFGNDGVAMAQAVYVESVECAEFSGGK